MIVEFYDPTIVTQDMRIEVVSYSWNDRGGPKLAEIKISGSYLWGFLRQLGRKVVIRNEQMTPVWWGYLEEATVSEGAMQVGLSLEEMYNRVRVACVFEEFGAPVHGVTDWAENAESITHFGFVKEREITDEMKVTSVAMAYDHRDNLLAQTAFPVATAGFTGSAQSGEQTATLHCAGYIYSFQWQLYQQLAGLESNETNESSEQIMGQGITDDRFGFTQSGKASDLEGRFIAFQAGSNIVITGSDVNDRYTTIESVDSREPVVVDTTGIIAFDPNDDINGPMDFVESDDFIEVGETSLNNRVWRIRAVGEDTATVYPKEVQNEPSPTGYIKRGNYIKLPAHPDLFPAEFPETDQNVTITVIGTKVAQMINLTHPVSWTLDAIELPIYKIGSPTDNVVVSIRTESAGLPTSTVLASSTVAGTNIGSEPGIERFEFNNTLNLVHTTNYFIHIERSGSNNINNYYVLEMDEKLNYSGGGLAVWTGLEWLGREPNAHLVFRVLGAWNTKRQIEELFASTNQLLNSIRYEATTATESHQYRAGDTYAYDELMGLLDAGRTTGGLGLMAKVTLDLDLLIEPAPAEGATNYQIDKDGNFWTMTNQPLAEGHLPVGQWIHLADIPPVVASAHKLSPKYLAEAEYDGASGRIRPVWAGESDPWEEAP